jgi:hypothetical protein
MRIPNISVYSNSSPFVQHNRCVDRAIRTIRDGIGLNDLDFNGNETGSKVVYIYNNTPHDSLKTETIKTPLTPAQVEANHDLENLFIRENQKRLETVRQMQEEEDLFNFTKGNIIMVHLDYSRTPLTFMKVRRNFQCLAEFLSYEHGNVRCRLLGNVASVASTNAEQDKSNTFDPKSKVIIVPIYYRKFVSANLKSLPERFKNYFF